MSSNRWFPALALCAVLALATLARWHPTSSGVPDRVFERTDEVHYVDQAVRYLNGRWQTNYFVNPTLTMYLLYAVSALSGWAMVALGRFDSYADFVLEATLNPYLVTVIGRVLTVVASVAGVAALYAIGRRMFHWRVGLVAAAALAVNRIHVERSTLAGNECLMVTLILAFFLLVLRYLDRPSARLHAACGALLGLAVATKYNAGIHAVTLLTASLAVALRSEGGLPLARRLARPRVWVGFPCIGVFFFAGCPWALIDFPEFWHDFRWQAAFLHEGHSLRDIENAQTGYVEYVLQFPRRNNGIWIAVLCGLGIVLAGYRALWRRDVRHWLLLAASLPTYLFLGSGIFVEMRFLLVAIPFFLLLGAWALDAVVQEVGRRAAALASRGEPAVAWEAALPLVLAAAMLWPHGRRTVEQFERVYSVDYRGELLEWLHETLDESERYFDVCSPRSMRFFTATDASLQLRLQSLETREERRLWQQHRKQFFRSRQIISLLRDADTFEELRGMLTGQEERHVIVSMLAPPGNREAEPKRLLRRSLMTLLRRGAYTARNWDYWDEVVDFLVDLEMVGFRVAGEGEAFICILELPE